MKTNNNSMLKHKKHLKTLENSGIWPREGGASKGLTSLAQNVIYLQKTILLRPSSTAI